MVWLLSLFLLTASSAFGQAPAPSPLPSASGVPYTAPFTYSDLKTLIKDKGVTSIDQLIPLLPADLKSNFSLVYDSKSTQGSSAKAPRAILFGKNANLVISFNGDPTEVGYNNIETMQFDPKKNKFNFREIDFPKDGGAPTYTSTNPTSCTSCHGTNPRPIWGSYPNWPGVYGSDDESLKSTPGEVDKFKQYQAFAPTSKRYSALLPPSGSDQTPYPGSSAPVKGDLTYRPNTRLGLFLVRMNARKIASELEAKGLGTAALAATVCDQKYLDPVSKIIGQKSAPDLDDVLKSAGYGYLDTSLASYTSGLTPTNGSNFLDTSDGTIPDSSYDGNELNTFGAYVAGQLAADYVKKHPSSADNFPEVSIAEEYGPNSTIVSAGLGADREAILSQGDSISEATSLQSVSDDSTCKELQSQMEKDLASVPCRPVQLPVSESMQGSVKQVKAAVKVASNPASNVQAALKTCLQCHGGLTGGAPSIPFGQPELLTAFISKHPQFLSTVSMRLNSTDPSVRMPLGQSLPSDVTPQEMINYFTSLK